MFEAGIGLWVGFNLLILALLVLDLGVFHRNSHEVTLKEATGWSAVWISLGLLFGLGIYLYWDTLVPGSSYSNESAALAYITGYLIEKSLAVDNIFVFVLVFSYFAVPPRYQHRVLFWGIIGALVMRAILIFAGVALIQTFHWVIYVFGAFLVVTGFKMLRAGDMKLDPEKNPLVRLARRLFPVTEAYEGDRFFVKRNMGGKLVRMATPLFLVLLMIEATDLVFAVDSIPAILAVTQEPFLVYTSNVFAILGLRSMYFMLAGVVPKFVYLKPALSFILVWVGAKMLLVDLFKVPTLVSLGVVVTVLVVAVLASIRRNRQLAAQGAELGPAPTGAPEAAMPVATPDARA